MLLGWHRSSHSGFFPFVFIFMAHSAGVINLAYFCCHAVDYWKHFAKIISELMLKADARQKFFWVLLCSHSLHPRPFPPVPAGRWRLGRWTRWASSSGRRSPSRTWRNPKVRTRRPHFLSLLPGHSLRPIISSALTASYLSSLPSAVRKVVFVPVNTKLVEWLPPPSVQPKALWNI